MTIIYGILGAVLGTAIYWKDGPAHIFVAATVLAGVAIGIWQVVEAG